MSTFLINYTTPILAFGTILLNIVTILLFVVLVAPQASLSRFISRYITQRVVWGGFVVALGTIIGSLVYSDIIGFEPCLLCWWTRVLIYPQVIVYAVGLYTKDTHMWLYSLVLGIASTLVSLYQMLLQYGLVSEGVCVATSVSCSKIYFTLFGYVTIPSMALSAGVFFIIISLFIRKFNT